jgi:hypothetical protein
MGDPGERGANHGDATKPRARGSVEIAQKMMMSKMMMRIRPTMPPGIMGTSSPSR